jgi:tRNA 2-selenouridine synthase
MPDEARVRLLLEDYAHLTADATAFNRLLGALVELRGRETVNGWQEGARAGRWGDVFLSLMRSHYDPIYLRSMQRNFAGFETATPLRLADGAAPTLARVAHELLARCGVTTEESA